MELMSSILTMAVPGVFSTTNPDDGTVYQKGIIEPRTENGSDMHKILHMKSFDIPIRQQNPSGMDRSD